jgi:ABC-2 type transport system permease protein
VIATSPRLRHIGAVNWIGLWTLYLREVQRFFKVFNQTVAAPVVTTLLFLAIFMLAMGGNGRMVGDIPYIEFLVPGLIMMAINQNAFANTISSLMMGKVQGNIVDVLTPPLSALELMLGFALGGATRGLIVGVAVGLALELIEPFRIVAPLMVVYHAVAASLLLSLMGIVGGLWSEKFDHAAAVTNFVVVPLTFLSGTFYSAAQLPVSWRFVAHINPFFYMIDGFRYGFIGYAEGSLLWGGIGIGLLDLGLMAVCYWLFVTGYKLKA